jgi:hypothetical protein
VNFETADRFDHSVVKPAEPYRAALDPVGSVHQEDNRAVGALQDCVLWNHWHAVPCSVAPGLVDRERTVAVRLQHLSSDGARGPPR